MVELEEEKLISLCEKALKNKVPATSIVQMMSDAMEEVGKRYEESRYFLPDLIFAGNMMDSVLKMVQPHLRMSGMEAAGKVVVGTVEGDLHDLGKNLVTQLLRSAGFEVIDLGVNVTTERFVNAVKMEEPDVLGMSALLTTTMNKMKEVIDALREAKLRGEVKVMVGGRPVTREFAKTIGADAYAETAVDGVKIARELLNKHRLNSINS